MRTTAHDDRLALTKRIQDQAGHLIELRVEPLNRFLTLHPIHHHDSNHLTEI